MGVVELARGRKAAAVDTGPVEGPWDLPDGWRWERLGNLVEKSSAKHQPNKASSLPFVGLENIPPHEMRLDRVGSFADMRSAGSAFKPGDVLYGRLRPYLNKVWVADRAGACSGELLVLRPKAGMDARFVALNLHSQRYVYYASHIVSGDRPRIDFDIVGAFPVPVPDEATQQRVVARIDALCTEIDEGEAALAEARAGVETYRKSLLKAAVTGELTADWRQANPPQETGKALLARLLDDVELTRNEGKAKRRSKVQPIEFSPDVLDLMWKVPSNWQWVPLGSIAFVTKLAGFEYTKYVQYSDDGDLPVIKAENAGLHGFKPTNFSRVHTASVEELGRSRLFGGELLMVFVGAGTGNVATVPDDQQYFLGPNIAMMRLETQNVEPRYVELFLRSMGGKALAMAFAKAVAQPSLSMGTIRQIPIAVPPHREQLAILRELELTISRGDDAGGLVSDARSNASTLRQSILAAAFRGELA